MPTARAKPTPSIPFARYIPDSVRLFIEVRRLDEADAALNRAHVWNLLPMLSGGSAASGKTFNLSMAVASLLGLEVQPIPEGFLRSEMGLMASSWQHPENAVWFFRVRKKAILDRWFPPASRRRIGTVGRARFFQTTKGVIVCVRGEVVAVSRQWGADSLLNESMKLMSGQQGATLEQSTVFRELSAFLPSDSLALLYLGADEEKVSATATATPSLFWPDIERAVIGLYEGQGRIDMAIRASLTKPFPTPRLSEAAIDRLLKLPQTTLFALATTLDFDQAYAAAAQPHSSRSLAHYLSLLSMLPMHPGGQGGHRNLLGPNVIFAAGNDLRDVHTIPQLAILAECSQDRAARQWMEHVADRIIRLIRILDPTQGTTPPTIQESSHLGVTIQHIPLRAYAEKSQLPLIKLLRNADPAWTAWNGWLIVALDRVQIERILDTQFGLLPALGSIRDAAPLRERPVHRSLLSIIQADLVKDVCEQWLAAYHAGDPSFLDPAWWQEHSPSGSPDRSPFGMTLEESSDSGMVTVTKVDTNTVAGQRLRVGDRVFGVDGQWFSLTSPKADLTAKLRDSRAVPGPRVRLLRDGVVVEVVLPRDPAENPLPGLRTKPADALRELASLGETLQFASFAVNSSDPLHYSARLSLRFLDTPAPTVKPTGRPGTQPEEQVVPEPGV